MLPGFWIEVKLKTMIIHKEKEVTNFQKMFMEWTLSIAISWTLRQDLLLLKEPFQSTQLKSIILLNWRNLILPMMTYVNKGSRIWLRRMSQRPDLFYFQILMTLKPSHYLNEKENREKKENDKKNNELNTTLNLLS